jgi:hypothetical protein
MAHLYDRTVAELMEDAAAELHYPASRSDVVAWFAVRYPEIKASTVRANIVGLTVNDRSRHHYAWLARRDPLFIRRENGTLDRFEADGITELESDEEIEDGSGTAAGVRARGLPRGLSADQLGQHRVGALA